MLSAEVVLRRDFAGLLILNPLASCRASFLLGVSSVDCSRLFLRVRLAGSRGVFGAFSVSSNKLRFVFFSVSVDTRLDRRGTPLELDSDSDEGARLRFAGFVGFSSSSSSVLENETASSKLFLEIFFGEVIASVGAGGGVGGGRSNLVA